MTNILFLGIKQVTKTTFDSVEEFKKKGYIWFVRTDATDEKPEHFEVYLGSVKYGEINSSSYVDELVEKIKTSIGLTDELELPSDFNHDSIVSGITDLESSFSDLEEQMSGVTEEFNELSNNFIANEYAVSKAISLLRDLIGANNVFSLSPEFKYDNLVDAINDRYTKEEVNKLILGVFRFKGVVEYEHNLYDITEKEDGDVYQVTYRDSEEGKSEEEKIKVNSEYVWSKSIKPEGEWIELGSIFDTSSLEKEISALTSDVSGLVLSILDIEDELDEKADITYVDSALTNAVAIVNTNTKIENVVANEETIKRFYREDDNDIFVTDFEPIEVKCTFTKNNVSATRDNIFPHELITVENNTNLTSFVLDDINGVRINAKKSTIESLLTLKFDESVRAVDVVVSTYYYYNASTGKYSEGDKSELPAGLNAAYSSDKGLENGLTLPNGVNDLPPEFVIDNVINGEFHTINDSITIRQSDNTKRIVIQKIILYTDSDYKWKQIAKIEDVDAKIDELYNSLSDVAKTGNYSDLKEKPTIGDVQIFDYDVLPNPSHDYDKIIARTDYDLYEIMHGSGWSFNPIRFSEKYPNITGQVNPKTNLREYMNISLGYDDGETEKTIAKDEYFEDCSYVMTNNTVGKGIQIGTSSSYGSFVMRMRAFSQTEATMPQFRFNKVTVGIEQYSYSDYVNLFVEIGNFNPEDGTYIISDTVNEYIEPSEDRQKQKRVININYPSYCNTLKIYTKDDGVKYGRRCIINQINFEPFEYFVENDNVFNKTFNENLYWKLINNKNNNSFYIEGDTLFI